MEQNSKNVFDESISPSRRAGRSDAKTSGEGQSPLSGPNGPTLPEGRLNSRTRSEEIAQKRRWWPRRLTRRVALALLLLLGLAGWQYGWPPRSWETTVYPLEEIGWLEAARLTPAIITPGTLGGGARHALLAEGVLDSSGNPRFEVDPDTYVAPSIAPLYDKILPNLRLPNLAGKHFRAGVFSIDTSAEDKDELATQLDPAAAWNVLLMCDDSKPWEEAAELVIDLNRNRDLTDDPVMTRSDAWSNEFKNTRVGYNWFYRVFDTLELSRTTSEHDDSETTLAKVEILPALMVAYWEGDSAPDRVYLAIYPTFFRKGRLGAGSQVKDVVITPDPGRFGRFSGHMSGIFPVDGGRRSDPTWNYSRGTFWGYTLDGDGQELRDGPYEGPIGAFCVQTASGERLRIKSFSLRLCGENSHAIASGGWAPVPRLHWFTVPVKTHLLPIGDYLINSLTLTRGRNCLIVIESGLKSEPSPREFAVHEAETTRLRLPKALDFNAWAALEVRPRPYVTEWAWSSEADSADEEPNAWNGPQPGCKITFGVEMTDPATDNRYAIYRNSVASADAIRVVIRDETGKIVHLGTMEYG